MSTALDLIAIGRVSVDLYGQQIGSRLEDVSTFAKALGGCPANVAIGVARLGLKPALISRVGDEPMGRFVREPVPLVRGLVAAGSILTGGAQAWLAGEKSDETATVEIAARFAALVEVWSTVRDSRLDRAERSAN